MLNSGKADALFGASKVLVPAKSLINDKDVAVDHDAGSVEYYHILCDEHVVLDACGMAAESLLPAYEMVQKLPDPAREELEEIFPEIGAILERGRSCYPILRNFEARLLGHSMGILR